MIETKSLVKIYKPKKGVPVRALDGVDIRFPDTGMVFLLGKSGSGKSTLLNVLGGLDKYDAGEIIIKGVSSKSFKQRDFDSYRNTYVGFIFQEYNILEEFTVGANIALALELQGKKATDDELNRILKEVELEGYGNRRPNELSGGQKQRVAIARALVKSPEIIMADEPSGALDSETGKQVFETLKKLSKEKLVVVVSHDRDFAMEYADRIIELADGKVISDISYDHTDDTLEIPQETEIQKEEKLSFNGNTAIIPTGYHLTEEDRIAINEYIDKLNSGMFLEIGGESQQIEKTAEKVYRNKFVPTDVNAIKNSVKSPFTLIKSKLSFKNSFKIGAGGLKYKKFRLVMTIILSTIAFTLFGLADTFSAYDHISATVNSVYDSKVDYAAVVKKEELEGISLKIPAMLNNDGVADLSKDTGIDFQGVIANTSLDMSFGVNLPHLSEDDEDDIYVDYFYGITEITEANIKAFGYEMIAGRMPDGDKNEIVISKFIAEGFVKRGYNYAVYDKENDAYEYVGDTVEINQVSDIVGKRLYVSGTEYTVVGVLDTKFETSRYGNDLSAYDSEGLMDAIVKLVLSFEFESEMKYSYTGLIMFGKGAIERFTTSRGGFVYDSEGISDLSGETAYFCADSYAKFSNINKDSIIWLNGKKDSLGDKEVIISLNNALGVIVEYDRDGKIVPIGKMSSQTYFFSNMTNILESEEGFKIVGVFDESEYGLSLGGFVFSDNTFEKYYSYLDGQYTYALGAMPKDKDGVEALVKYCYDNENGDIFALNNPASLEVDTLNSVLNVVSKIFLAIGIFFAIFASILLSNFIATSISYKKQEIGILRAIGARSNDVFRIFFAEAFIIATTNFVLAFTGTGVITFIINIVLRRIGLLVTVLNFGIRQFIILAIISIGVAFVASFLPVKKIASKRPIDAIRNR